MTGLCDTMPLRYQPLCVISGPCGTWPWIFSISPRETQPCLGPPCEIFLRGAIAEHSRKNSSIVFKKHWLIVGTASILCRHKRLAMPLSAEQQFRARARKAILEKQWGFKPRDVAAGGGTNGNRAAFGHFVRFAHSAGPSGEVSPFGVLERGGDRGGGAGGGSEMFPLWGPLS